MEHGTWLLASVDFIGFCQFIDVLFKKWLGNFLGISDVGVYQVRLGCLKK